MTLNARFEDAVKKVSSGVLGNLSQNEQLDLYGLYSVVQKGEAPSEGPSAFLDPRKFAKWTAWASESHLSKDAAMERYIELVVKLGGKPESAKQEEGSEVFGNKASTGFTLSSEGEQQSSELDHDICYWATLGDVKSVKYCIEVQGVSPNFRDQDGLTPLMRAVDRNEELVVDILLDAGAEVDAQDEEGQTALHYAVYCEHAEMAGLLVTYGAALDKKDNEDLTPLEAATVELAQIMQDAKSGAWKRKTRLYPRTGLTRTKNTVRTMHVALGLSFVLAFGLIVVYRYRR